MTIATINEKQAAEIAAMTDDELAAALVVAEHEERSPAAAYNYNLDALRAEIARRHPDVWRSPGFLLLVGSIGLWYIWQRFLNPQSRSSSRELAGSRGGNSMSWDPATNTRSIDPDTGKVRCCEDGGCRACNPILPQLSYDKRVQNLVEEQKFAVGARRRVSQQLLYEMVFEGREPPPMPQWLLELMRDLEGDPETQRRQKEPNARLQAENMAARPPKGWMQNSDGHWEPEYYPHDLRRR